MSFGYVLSEESSLDRRWSCRHPILVSYDLRPAKCDCTMTKQYPQKFYLKVGRKQNLRSILWSPFLVFRPFSIA